MTPEATSKIALKPTPLQVLYDSVNDLNKTQAYSSSSADGLDIEPLDID